MGPTEATGGCTPRPGGAVGATCPPDHVHPDYLSCVVVLRAIGAVGRMMIRIGVLILLFVAYQLWGTGLHTSRAQDDLQQEFRSQQEQLGQLPGEPASDATTPSTTLAPTPTLPPQVAPTTDEPPERGAPLGFI